MILSLVFVALQSSFCCSGLVLCIGFLCLCLALCVNATLVAVVDSLMMLTAAGLVQCCGSL